MPENIACMSAIFGIWPSLAKSALRCCSAAWSSEADTPRPEKSLTICCIGSLVSISACVRNLMPSIPSLTFVNIQTRPSVTFPTTGKSNVPSCSLSSVTDAANTWNCSALVRPASPALSSVAPPCSSTALSRACFFSASVNDSALFPRLSAYALFAATASTVMPRLSRISGEARPMPVTMLSNACCTVMPIALERSRAISMRAVNCSVFWATPKTIARFAESMMSRWLMVPALAR